MKLLGYILSIIGLTIIALSQIIVSFLPFLKSMPKGELYTLLAGFILVAVGVTLALSGSSSSSKIKQAEEEVPIYEGEGKKRRIVGYKKGKK